MKTATSFRTTGWKQSALHPTATLKKTVDLEDRRLPEIPSYFKEDIADILDFVNDKLDQEDHLPRGDYKELLELVKLILGGEIERKKGYHSWLDRGLGLAKF